MAAFCYTMRMNLKVPLLALAALAAVTGAAEDVVIENAAFRLVISQDGAATSLVAKATDEECLAPGVRIPFARLRQDRPYDNEMHLLHPAKPMWFNANRIVRNGDALEIGFAHEYHVLRVRLIATDDYVAFVPDGTEYVLTDDFGDKRRTEIDGLEFLRLPVRDRAHFGACANVAWDARTAVAVMGLQPEVHIDGAAPEGASGWRLFSAGTENLRDSSDAVPPSSRTRRGSGSTAWTPSSATSTCRAARGTAATPSCAPATASSSAAARLRSGTRTSMSNGSKKAASACA